MSALLGRLRGKSRPPTEGDDPGEFEILDYGDDAGGRLARANSIRARQQSRGSADSGSVYSSPNTSPMHTRAGPTAIGVGPPPRAGSPRGFQMLSRQGSGHGAGVPVSLSGSGSAFPPRGRSGSDGPPADPHALQLAAELNHERQAVRAFNDLQDLHMQFTRGALRILRRENLGKGGTTDDIWEMRDLSNATDRREAVEFSDADGDAVRFLLQNGVVHLCINGAMKGKMRNVLYSDADQCLRAKPWKISLKKVPLTKRPVLLSHLGRLLSKGGVAHNLPAQVAEAASDATKELAAQLTAQRTAMTKILKELEETKDMLNAAEETAEGAETATNEFMNMQERLAAQAARITSLEMQVKKKQLDTENLQNALGKKARDETALKDKLSEALVKQEGLKQSLEHANGKRRDAEEALRMREGQVMALKREQGDGKHDDRVEINRLTCQLGDALEDNGKLRLNLSTLEAKVVDLQTSMQDAALRRQQAEQALANYENSNQKLMHSLNNIKLDMAQSNGADAELLEETKRAQVLSEEYSAFEHMYMWFHAERRVIAVRQRFQQQEKGWIQRLEASGRLLLDSEERGRREYLGIWLRAELRQVANDAAAGLERNAVIAQRDRNKETRYRLHRTRHALARAVPNALIRQLSGSFRTLHVHMVYMKFLRVRKAGAAVLQQINDVLTIQRAYARWRLWKSEHTHDRTLAIRLYLQQRPVFYLEEHMNRVTHELEEEHARRQMLELSHLGVTELLTRAQIAADGNREITDVFCVWMKGVPIAGTRESIHNQLVLVKDLLRMEEQKVREMDKTMHYLRKQREDMSRHNTMLLAEASKMDVLKLFYGHLDGKRALEVEHLQGIINTLHGLAFPKRRSTSHGGWVLSSLNDWKGGGTWEHRFLWLDVMKGQLMYSSKDPRLSGGPEVKSIRLANIVAVEVELFTDGLKPPPVSRYQQLGFYIEMNKGGKHRFCAATVGERTEWLDNLRRSLLSVWRTAEAPVTMVSPRLPNAHLVHASPHRGGPPAGGKGNGIVAPSESMPHHTARSAMKAVAASPEAARSGSPTSPSRSPSYRSSRGKPRGTTAPPYIPQLALSQLGGAAESPPRLAGGGRQTSMPKGMPVGIPLEHQSYMGL